MTQSWHGSAMNGTTQTVSVLLSALFILKEQKASKHAPNAIPRRGYHLSALTLKQEWQCLVAHLPEAGVQKILPLLTIPHRQPCFKVRGSMTEWNAFDWQKEKI